MARAIDIVRKVAPRALPNYLTAFENGDPLLSQAGITTPLRLAHFLAQVLEETGGLTITVESGNYSAERMCEVWPSRFHSIAEATPYAHNAEKLFNMVYANRMGNGPPESGDGFKYRGRGVLQTTGRGDYQQFGKLCGVDFEGSPDLIFAPEHALKPALAEWTRANCNPLADKDDIRAITLKVNGGYTNLAERDRWLGVLKPLIKSVEFRDSPRIPAAGSRCATAEAGHPNPCRWCRGGWNGWRCRRAPGRSRHRLDHSDSCVLRRPRLHHRQSFNRQHRRSFKMTIAIGTVFACITLYVILDLVRSFMSATGTIWQKALAAGKNSATILWQRLVLATAAFSGASRLAGRSPRGTGGRGRDERHYPAAIRADLYSGGGDCR